MQFDVVIIGKGMMGAAAAKYLAGENVNTAVIGPDEPANVQEATVFASHYDQARVQRLIGKDGVWTRLNVLSAHSYKQLQLETGIAFHGSPGCLYVNPYGSDTYLQQAQVHAAPFDLQYQSFQSGETIRQSFPDFYFPTASNGLFESAPAGFINPRLLIQAQLCSFKKNNGSIITEVVTRVQPDKLRGYIISTQEGNTYHSGKILLAPGAFTNFFDLTDHQFAFTIKSEIILLARVLPKEAARLSALPSLLYEIDSGIAEGIYLIQPVLYPDGHYYLKMGCNLPEDIFFENLDQVQQWFKQGNSDQFTGRMQQALATVMPGLRTEAFLTKRCVITRTQTGRPYISKLDDHGLYIATGGNGYAAMCSDAIGRVAAGLVMHDALSTGFSAENFAPVFV